jgi:hypothetical protein
MYIGYFWFPFCFERQCQWYFQQPAIQASLHSISYQIFLLLLTLSDIFKPREISLKKGHSDIFEYCNRTLSMDGKCTYYQNTIVSWYKIFVLIWMIGHIYLNVSKMIRQRRRLEIMDLFTTILFFLYTLLFTIAAIQIHLEWKYVNNIEKWKYFEKLHHGE